MEARAERAMPRWSSPWSRAKKSTRSASQVRTTSCSRVLVALKGSTFTQLRPAPGPSPELETVPTVFTVLPSGAVPRARARPNKTRRRRGR